MTKIKTKIKEMTWDLIMLYVTFFILGVVALIVFAIYHNNEKTGDPTTALILGLAFALGGIGGFIQYLLEKEEGKSTPDTQG